MGPDGIQFGFISFGSQGYLDIDFDAFDNVEDWTSELNSVPWKRGSSNIADAIRVTRQLFSDVHGHRDGVPRLCILLTDGPASAEQSRTLLEAQEARETHEIEFMVIGVTERVREHEVFGIASLNYSDHVRLLSGFQGLSQENEDGRTLTSHIEGLILAAGGLSESPGE